MLARQLVVVEEEGVLVAMAVGYFRGVLVEH